MNDRKRRIEEWIADIFEGIKNIGEDIEGYTFESFLASGKTKRAVLNSLSDIGEAAGRLRAAIPDLEKSEPELWDQLVGASKMRNVIVHEYFHSDATVVWATIENDLPPLGAILDEYSKRRAGPTAERGGNGS